MSNANHGSSFRAARRYRRAAIGLIVFGALAAFVGGHLGVGTVGLVVYVIAALSGFGVMAYVRFHDSLSLGDERLSELERRASHYTVALVGGVGWLALVGASLLDATGARQMTATEQTLLWTYAGFFLTWGIVYVALRYRR